MPDLPSPLVAARLAGALLSPLGNRWLHTQGVAEQAIRLSAAVDEHERQLLVVAAWWHDLGYAPGLKSTGMHQIDGAQFIADMGFPTRLASLVAHHSASKFEASERGFSSLLDRWKSENSAVTDVLWTADMTTGPIGESLEYPDRLREIVSRYGEDSVVGRAMLAARLSITLSIERTKRRLAC